MKYVANLMVAMFSAAAPLFNAAVASGEDQDTAAVVAVIPAMVGLSVKTS